MNKIDFTFKIGGPAGFGINSAGLIFAKTALKSGYFVFTANEYPSLIRGGHNVFGVRVSETKPLSSVSRTDLLIALDETTFDLHKKELSENSVVILNSGKYQKSQKILPVPFSDLAKQSGGTEVMMNNVALGAAIFLLKADQGILKQVIKEVFAFVGKKGVELNVKAALAGFDFAKENFAKVNISFSLAKTKPTNQILLSGNDALCLGAVRAGCNFFSSYPMTPINSMITYFAQKVKDLGIVYYQPEDEISGINSAIGASLAGARAMVATSGGGFSLMVEALGLAGMTETPLVVVEGQRPGPSSGMPTWSGQGDLRFVLGAGQDDFPKIVFAPGDVQECFEMAFEAFNLADIYQCPVIILVDKNLCESQESLVPFNGAGFKIDRGKLVSGKPRLYQRYLITKTGISPRAFIGQPGFVFPTSSYEHDQKGFADDSSENRVKMMKKRMAKLTTLEKAMPKPVVFGLKTADIGLISWGSNKGAVLEAQKILAEQGIATKFLHLNFLLPFPIKSTMDFLKTTKKVLLVEQNITSQLGSLIREKTGIDIANRLLKYNGRLIFPEEIVKRIETLI